jgi:hypothetical protein
LSDDYERVLQSDARLFVDGFRDRVPTRVGRRLVKKTFMRTRFYVNEGVRDKDELLRRVQADIEQEFGSIILLAILAAVVQFVVLRILKRIFPENNEADE